MSTILEPALFQSAKLEAVRQRKQISEIISEALELYLKAQGAAGGSDVVARSWAALPFGPGAVRKIMEEEDSLLDAR